MVLSKKEALNEIVSEVQKFLLIHGGMENGYETYMNAEFEIRHYSDFEWHTPSCGDKTLNKIEKLSFDFSKKISDDILVKNNIDTPIVITSEHREHGCFIIKAHFKVTQQVCPA